MIIMDDVIKNLYILFDAAWKENMDGRGTDVTRMVTTFVPGAIQDLQAYEDMFKNSINDRFHRHEVEEVGEEM